jgi:hypothetical protein
MKFRALEKVTGNPGLKPRPKRIAFWIAGKNWQNISVIVLDAA